MFTVRIRCPSPCARPPPRTCRRWPPASPAWFADDPVKFPHRRQGAAGQADRAVLHGLRTDAAAHGLVFTTPGREGGALWAPPGRWKVPLIQIIKATPQFLRLYGWRFVPNLGVLSTLEKAHPTEPHYYLEFLGTDPAHQGRGIGSTLLQPVLDRCDDEGVGAYLESKGVQRPLLRPPRLHRVPRAGAPAQRPAPVAHVARPALTDARPAPGRRADRPRGRGTRPPARW